MLRFDKDRSINCWEELLDYDVVSFKCGGIVLLEIAVDRFEELEWVVDDLVVWAVEVADTDINDV